MSRDLLDPATHDVDSSPARVRHALAWTLSTFKDSLAGKGVPADHVISFAEATLQETPDGDVVEIDTDLAMDLLKAMRGITMRLAPPEDYKPEKHLTDEEAAAELVALYRRFQTQTAASMGVDLPATATQEPAA